MFFFASGFWIYIVLGLVLVLVPGDYMFIFNLPNTPFFPKTNPKKIRWPIYDPIHAAGL